MQESSKLDKSRGTFISFNRQRLAQYFFFGVFLLLLYQFLLMVSPFFLAVLGAAVLAMIIYPIHQKILTRMHHYPGTASIVTTTLVVVIIVLPVTLLGWVFVKETSTVYPAAKAWMDSVRNIQANSPQISVPESVQKLWDSLRDFLEFWNIDLQDIFLKNLNALSDRTAHIATTLIEDTLFVGFNLMVLTFVLFFFLRDGPTIINRLTELVPLAHEYKKEIQTRIEDTLFAVLRGILTVAAIQGFLTGIGFRLFGVPFPVLLGVLTTILSPMPIVGGAVIWVPVTACLALAGDIPSAVHVGLWCLLIVTPIDHILRPILIGSKAKIPILLLFFGILGGLRVYGFAGLLIGPLVIALVLAFISIYRQEYQWLLGQSQDKPA